MYIPIYCKLVFEIRFILLKERPMLPTKPLVEVHFSLLYQFWTIFFFTLLLFGTIVRISQIPTLSSERNNIFYAYECLVEELSVKDVFFEISGDQITKMSSI